MKEPKKIKEKKKNRGRWKCECVCVCVNGRNVFWVVTTIRRF